MSSNQPASRAATVQTEPKARGANRSTKVAGKLKVLPEQPEPIIPKDQLRQEPAASAPPRRDEGEGSATAGDSEDEDGDDEIDTEDVEVRVTLLLRGVLQPDRLGRGTGVQPDRPHSCRYCAARCTPLDKEESKVAASRHRICHCIVRVLRS